MKIPGLDEIMAQMGEFGKMLPVLERIADDIAEIKIQQQAQTTLISMGGTVPLKTLDDIIHNLREDA